MLGNYGQLGWDLPDDDYESNDSGSNKFTPEEKLWRFRFKMEDAQHNPINQGDPVTHRILFLNGSPFTFWEHSMFPFKSCGHWTAMCLQKNKIDDRGCPVCKCNEKERYPYFIGMFGIIDIGQIEYSSGGKVKLHHRQWTDSKGETHENVFPRLLLCAKMGSKKNPGVLVKLQRHAQRKGDTLDGTVWDVTRSGDKEASIGEDWEYIDRIAPDDYAEYLSEYRGIDDLNLDVSPVTNWRDICKPLSYEKLCQITGVGNYEKSNRGYSHMQGASYGPPDDDDVPF